MTATEPSLLVGYQITFSRLRVRVAKSDDVRYLSVNVSSNFLHNRVIRSVFQSSVSIQAYMVVPPHTTKVE